MITERTVREVAVEVPHATRVFEKFGIDYCCGGGRPLGAACAEKGVAIDEVLKAIESESDGETRRLGGGQDWQTARLSELVEHITSTHHFYIRQESPRIQKLLAKIAEKHGPKHPEVVRVQQSFGALAGELNSHLAKEENILFPYIVQIEEAAEAGMTKRRPMFGTVQNPIHMMEIEHDSAGEALRRIREETNNYTAPEDGCTTFKATYAALQAFEADLHQHVHLENNILFPRAIALENS